MLNHDMYLGLQACLAKLRNIIADLFTSLLNNWYCVDTLMLLFLFCWLRFTKDYFSHSGKERRTESAHFSKSFPDPFVRPALRAYCISLGTASSWSSSVAESDQVPYMLLTSLGRVCKVSWAHKTALHSACQDAGRYLLLSQRIALDKPELPSFHIKNWIPLYLVRTVRFNRRRWTKMCRAAPVIPYPR